MAGAAIAGLGFSELGKVYGRSASSLAADAVRNAVTDAGLTLADVDGLLVSGGIRQDLTPLLATTLNLGPLGLLAQVNAFGATAGLMVGMATRAVTSGTASVVVCVFADAPLKPRARASAAYSGASRAPSALTGLGGWAVAAGVTNPNTLYALATRRHMEEFGTTSEQLGAIAVAQRQWAAGNPLAQFRDPLTLEDHQASRWIAEPLHLLDCCLVSNGAIAVVVTTSDRAADLAQPAVHVWGHAQASQPWLRQAGSNFGLVSPAAHSGPLAMKMAGIRPSDVDIAELYDCYTFTVALTLEDYGFCGKGEGGPFAASGALAPGGELPCNTGGGQLSSHYLWGMTPLSEAVIQARGAGGERQAPKNDILVVSGNGGILEHHSTLVVSPHRVGR